jgi:hypothetical protein
MGAHFRLFKIFMLRMFLAGIYKCLHSLFLRSLGCCTSDIDSLTFHVVGYLPSAVSYFPRLREGKAQKEGKLSKQKIKLRSPMIRLIVDRGGLPMSMFGNGPCRLRFACRQSNTCTCTGANLIKAAHGATPMEPMAKPLVTAW